MVNSNIKLVALDVDGTIMDRSFQISGRVKDAITKASEKGVRVLIATGRMYSATVPIGQELGLQTPLITYQGSLIKEFYQSDKTLLHHDLEPELAYRIIQDARKKDLQINIYLDDNLYIEKESPIVREYIDRRTIPYFKVDSFEECKEFRPTKILAMDSDTEKINRIVNEFKEKYSGELNITKSTDYFCEFINKKCSKADGIDFLAKKWGIAPQEIMAIGDHDNDREMLDFAGLGVAMGNSHDDLKEGADYVTDTVNNDGAALAIEKFIL